MLRVINHIPLIPTSDTEPADVLREEISGIEATDARRNAEWSEMTRGLVLGVVLGTFLGAFLVGLIFFV